MHMQRAEGALGNMQKVDKPLQMDPMTLWPWTVEKEQAELLKLQSNQMVTPSYILEEMFLRRRGTVGKLKAQVELPKEESSQMVALHESEECKPCLYMQSRVGCLMGKSCAFCHLPHAPRKSKELKERWSRKLSSDSSELASEDKVGSAYSSELSSDSSELASEFQ